MEVFRTYGNTVFQPVFNSDFRPLENLSYQQQLVADFPILLERERERERHSILLSCI
jgi:hypothetical protein